MLTLINFIGFKIMHRIPENFNIIDFKEYALSKNKIQSRKHRRFAQIIDLARVFSLKKLYRGWLFRTNAIRAFRYRI